MSTLALEAFEFVASLIGDIFGDKIFGSSKKAKVALGIGYYLFNLVPARQIYDLDHQLNPTKPESNLQKAAALILPNWYNAFTIGKYAPEKTPQNEWMHSLGQIFFPSTYTAYQLAKIKKKAIPRTAKNEGVFAIGFAPSMYSFSVAKEFNKDPQKLNLLSQALHISPPKSKAANATYPIRTPKTPFIAPQASPVISVPLPRATAALSV